MFDPDPATFTFARVADGDEGQQVWNVLDGAQIVGRAEVFEAPNQWGVRITEQLPKVDDPSLLRVVARLLVWECGCRTDTVDVVLMRTQQHHALIRTGADYI